MAEAVRVRSKSTGHEYTTYAYDPEVHEKLKGPALDEAGFFLAPVHNPKIGSRKAPDAPDTPTQPASGPSTV